MTKSISIVGMVKTVFMKITKLRTLTTFVLKQCNSILTINQPKENKNVLTLSNTATVWEKLLVQRKIQRKFNFAINLITEKIESHPHTMAKFILNIGMDIVHNVKEKYNFFFRTNCDLFSLDNVVRWEISKSVAVVYLLILLYLIKTAFVIELTVANYRNYHSQTQSQHLFVVMWSVSMWSRSKSDRKFTGNWNISDNILLRETDIFYFGKWHKKCCLIK